MDPLEFTPNNVEAHTLFSRKCVECPSNVPLLCPNCPTGEVCIQVSPSCTECASRKCVPSSQSGAQNTNLQSQSSGPNIGAIVGGVIGGLLVIAALTFCLWWFVIRKRRQQWEQEYAHDFDNISEKVSQRDGAPGYPRERGTGVARSVASTTFTRSSNVIQIAFIPGVTDRTGDPNHTPPVPPIPSQPHSPFTDASGDHYFMPGDLRDSTYSGFTDDGASTIDRRSMARSIAPSIAPSLLRESVASHVFHNDAIANPMPAQTALRGRANVVSVRGGPSGSSSIPAIPTRFPVLPSGSAAAKNVVRTTPSTTQSTPHSVQSPFLHASPSVPDIQVTSDSSSEYTDALSIHSGQPQLRSAIEEATRRASSQPTHGGLGSVTRPPVMEPASRDPSPFSDANRIPSSTESTPGTDHGSPQL